MNSWSRRSSSTVILIIFILTITGRGSAEKPTGQEVAQGPFHFVRIRYNGLDEASGSGRWGPPPSMHDYPRAERNLLRAVSKLTDIETSPTSHSVLDLADPTILKYPLLYFSEPGYWDVVDEEATLLREFLGQGGFLLFDDFRGQREWENLVFSMGKVNPDWSFRKLTGKEPLFQAPFKVSVSELPAPYRVPGDPAYYGLFSPAGRLQGIACFNTDLGDYWELETGMPEVPAALRLGINFIVYALGR